MARTSDSTKSKLTTKQKTQMFDQFLTWPQNRMKLQPAARYLGKQRRRCRRHNCCEEHRNPGRRQKGAGSAPQAKPARPALGNVCVLHVHENPNCGPALKDGALVLVVWQHRSSLVVFGNRRVERDNVHQPLGQFPHLEVDADGTATKVVVAARLTLADVANRSIVIHAGHDEFSPEPLAAG